MGNCPSRADCPAPQGVPCSPPTSSGGSSSGATACRQALAKAVASCQQAFSIAKEYLQAAGSKRKRAEEHDTESDSADEREGGDEDGKGGESSKRPRREDTKP